jgi:hypothetical protein
MSERVRLDDFESVPERPADDAYSRTRSTRRRSPTGSERPSPAPVKRGQPPPAASDRDAAPPPVSPEDRALELARNNAAQTASPTHYTLADDVIAFIRRYVSLTVHQALVFALWLIHTHAIEAADHTPYMSISSPTKGCGKTTLGVKIPRLLAHNPRASAQISGAALFRAVGKGVTFLLDEMDALWRSGSERGEDIRAILNAGFGRGEGGVWRCVGHGSNQEEVEFPVFGPKVVIGIGRLIPETVHDRSLVIRLQKATRSTRLEKLRERRPPADAEALRERIHAWAGDHVEELKEAEPALPDELDARGQDIAEPLIAIADLLGCGTEARAAIVALRAGEAADTEDTLVLLQDISAVFVGERMPTTELLNSLIEIEGSPWGVRWADERDRRKAPTQLARMLREFDIRPHKLRVAGSETSTRGYRRTDFKDAFERYLPATHVAHPSGTEQPEHRDEDDDRDASPSRNTRGDVPAPLTSPSGVDTPMFQVFRVEEQRQDEIFRERLAAGDPVDDAARAAGLGPSKIPIRLAPDAPEILGDTTHTQLLQWEQEGRIPVGTASLAQTIRDVALVPDD